MIQEIGFALDSPVEEAGFELVWGFFCQVVVFGLLQFFVRSGKAVLRPSPAIGYEANKEGAIRAEELAEAGDRVGEAVWRRIIDAIGHLENTTPPGPLH